ncbi:hypothetical protein MMC13_005388 [Lambiella insularis]|nr:hypothetical protein [Lambiella insularis]
MEKVTGMHELWVPSDGQPILADIVFVHGLDGHFRETWTWTPRGSTKQGSKKRSLSPDNGEGPSNAKTPMVRKGFFGRPTSILLSSPDSSDSSAQKPDPPKTVHSSAEKLPSSVFWPKDLLPEALPNCRIFSWGYNADLHTKNPHKSRSTVFDHALTLLSNLTDERMEPKEIKRPIIFVAHSLGGIVVKYALNLSRNENGHTKAIYPATFGICFLGTPHRGSNVAELGEILMRMSRLWFNTPNLEIIKELKLDSGTLRIIQKQFTDNYPTHKINIRSWYEGLDYNGIEIVGQSSSMTELPGETPTMINANHVAMTKFESLKDPGYLSVSRALVRWLGTIQAEMVDVSTAFDQLKDGVLDCLKSLEDNTRNTRVEQVENAHQNTYLWLYDKATGFSKWLAVVPTSENSIFWITGKPGSGKSTLMKFAIHNLKTQQHLLRASPTPWSLIPFFFHDRGFDVQKTVTGLLQEMLYQLLSRYPPLIELILHVFMNNLQSKLPTLQTARLLQDVHFEENTVWDQETIATAKRLSQAAANHGFDTHLAWQLMDVEIALQIIVRQTKVKVQLCLFIDALDEHNGNHMALIKVLDKLVAQQAIGTVCLKMCLAGRSEPIFEARFAKSPGFAIHRHTERDIALYISDTIKSNIDIYNPPIETESLDQLEKAIAKAADGVFVWVKLVVHELVEEIIDGSNIQQLLELLASIPKELDDTYRRIIEKRKPSYLREAYIMLQVVLHSKRPLSLEALIAMTDIELRGYWIRSPVQDMQQRVLSRCGGLLMTVLSSADDKGPSTSPTYSTASESSSAATDASSRSVLGTSRVEFFHQTLKQFLQSSASAGFKWLPAVITTELKAYRTLFRFCVYLTTDMSWKEVLRMHSHLQDTFEYAKLMQMDSLHQDNFVAEFDKLLKISAFGFNDSDVPDDVRDEADCFKPDDLEDEEWYARPFSKDGLWVWSGVHDKVPGSHRSEIDFRGLDAAEYSPLHREFDLVRVGIRQGCFFYVGKKLESSLPRGLNDRQPLLREMLWFLSHKIDNFKCDGYRSLSDNPIVNCDGLYHGSKHSCVEVLDSLLIRDNLLSCKWEVTERGEPQPKVQTPLSEVLRGGIPSKCALKCLERLLKRLDPTETARADISSLINADWHSIRRSAHIYEAVAMLLENGADPMHQDSRGFHPLFYEIDHGHPHVAQLLCHYGADPAQLGNNASSFECLPRIVYENEDITGCFPQSFEQKVAGMYNILKQYKRSEGQLPLDMQIPAPRYIPVLGFELSKRLMEKGYDLTARTVKLTSSLVYLDYDKEVSDEIEALISSFKANPDPSTFETAKALHSFKLRDLLFKNRNLPLIPLDSSYHETPGDQAMLDD